MWTTYRWKAEFVTQLCASVPGQSSLIEGWLAARAPAHRPPQTKSLQEVAEEVVSTLLEPEEEERIGLIFQRVRGCLAVRLATWKAHVKDAAYQLQTYTAGYAGGEKSLRTKVANGFYFPPQHDLIWMHEGTPFIPVRDVTGTPIAEPTGIREKAIHIMTPQGPRSALKAFEYVTDAVIEFPFLVLTAPTRTVKRGKTKEGGANIIEVPGAPIVAEEDIKNLALYGGIHGYGGERSEDGGRYAATITKEKG